MQELNAYICNKVNQMENNERNGRKADHRKLHIESNSGEMPYRTERERLERSGRYGTDTASGSPSYGTRRVNGTQASKSKTSTRNAEESARIESGMSDVERRRRLEKKRKQERLFQQRMRALAALGAAAVLAVVLLFMTPIFNIREIRLNGNNTVSSEIIDGQIGDLVGRNIFATSSAKIQRKMEELPQISNAVITKSYFPASVDIQITESVPIAHLMCGSTDVVVDCGLNVIDDGSVFDTDKLTAISGVSVSEFTFNEPLPIESEEVRECLVTAFETFYSTGIASNVTDINVDDLTAVVFRYDNRLEVKCGSPVELERKIRMFSEALKTSVISGNSIGTVDISVPGQAVYEP